MSLILLSPLVAKMEKAPIARKQTEGTSTLQPHQELFLPVQIRAHNYRTLSLEGGLTMITFYK